jgi:ankyrin repeat protein
MSSLPLLFLQKKYTPLHVAVALGHAEVAKVLLAAGANVHATAEVSESGFMGCYLYA